MILNKNDELMLLSKDDRRFNEFVKYIKTNGYKGCMGGIQPNYIINTLGKVSHIAVVGTLVNRQLRSGATSINFSKVKGFALLNNMKKYLYLDLICGPGTGRVLFKHMDAIARKLNHTKIRLSAVPDAMLQYYKPEYGFKFTETCNMNTNVKQVADGVFERVVSFMSTQKELKKEMSRTNVSSNKRKLQQEYKKIETMKAKALTSLEKLLGDKNIVYKKGCAKTKNCGVYGYSMTKCL
jgi:hypothetical protein